MACPSAAALAARPARLLRLDEDEVDRPGLEPTLDLGEGHPDDRPALDLLQHQPGDQPLALGRRRPLLDRLDRDEAGGGAANRHLRNGGGGVVTVPLGTLYNHLVASGPFMDDGIHCSRRIGVPAGGAPRSARAQASSSRP